MALIKKANIMTIYSIYYIHTWIITTDLGHTDDEADVEDNTETINHNIPPTVAGSDQAQQGEQILGFNYKSD